MLSLLEGPHALDAGQAELEDDVGHQLHPEPLQGQLRAHAADDLLGVVKKQAVAHHPGGAQVHGALVGPGHELGHDAHQHLLLGDDVALRDGAKMFRGLDHLRSEELA